MDNYRKIIKLIITYIFILWQFKICAENGIYSFKAVTFNILLGKYTLCIFFGYISLIFDYDLLFGVLNEMTVTRFSSFRKRIATVLSSFAIRVLEYVGMIIIFIIISCFIYEVKFEISKSIVLYVAILFLYLLSENLFSLLLLLITKYPSLAKCGAIIVNTGVLIIVRYFSTEKAYAVFGICCFGYIVLSVFISCFIMKRSDIYVNKNHAHVFEK